MQGEAQAPDGDFAPNLVNTVCWLVSFAVQMCTFTVNYQGEPFNIPIRQNPLLLKTVQYSALLFLLLTLDVVPGLSSWFSLVRELHVLLQWPSCLHSTALALLNITFLMTPVHITMILRQPALHEPHRDCWPEKNFNRHSCR